MSDESAQPHTPAETPAAAPNATPDARPGAASNVQSDVAPDASPASTPGAAADAGPDAKSRSKRRPRGGSKRPNAHGGPNNQGGPKGNGPHGRGPKGGNPKGGRAGGPQRGGQGHPSPLESASRSTRNALKRHAESIRDEGARRACRAVLSGIVGFGTRAGTPAELLGIVEQVAQIAESSHPDFSQLPAPLRATVTFATDNPRKSRELLEMLRLVLRHGYALAADHIPRQMRNDANFRTGALRDVLTAVAAEYLDDAAFQAWANS